MADIEKIKVKGTDYTVVDSTVPSHVRAITQQNITDWGNKQDALTAGDGIAIDNNDTIRTTGLPYGECDSTSTATAFTATVPGIYKLEDGVCCIVKNGVVTSAANFTLNINGLGAKQSYNNMATGNDITPTAPTRDTTIFNINYTMLFIYSETIVSGGGWICYRGYDANTNTIGYQVRSNSYSLPASQKFYRYRLLFTSADGTHFVPANTSTSTNATASRTVNQTPIDPFGKIVYYGTTAAVDANARPAVANLWLLYTLTLGYSFNRTGAALTLTSWKPIYIKCAPLANGSAIIDETNPYVQDLPATNDGKIYIFLGVAYSATAIEMLPEHPIYYHDGTGIRIWTGKDCYSKTESDNRYLQSYTETDPTVPSHVKSITLQNITDWNNKQNALTFDNTPTSGSNNPVKSSGIKTAIDNVDNVYIVQCTQTEQNAGTTTISYNDIMAAVNAGKVVFYKLGDLCYKLESTAHPTFTAYSCADDRIVRLLHYVDASNGHSVGDIVRDSVKFQTELTFDNSPTANSNNPVTSLGIKSALDNKQNKPIELLIWLLQNFPSGLPDNEEDARTLTSDEAAALLNILDPSIKWTVFGIDAFIDIDYALNLGDYKWEVGLFGQSTNLTTIWIHKTNDNKYWAELQLRDLLFSDSFKTINNLIIVGSGNIDTSEFYKIPSEDCTAIFYATSGYIPNLTTLNTACDNMLAAIRNGKIPIMKFSDGSADVWVAALINYPESGYPSELSPMSFTTLYGNYTTYTITAYKDYNTSNWVVLGVQANLLSRLTFDSTPTANSYNPVTSGGIKTALSGKQDLLVSGTNIKTIQGNSLLGSGDVSLVADDIMTTSSLSIEEVLYEHNLALNGKQDTLVSGTNIKTVNNNSLLGSGDVSVQPTLVSGTNIKTINNESLLGSGNISIQGGGSDWNISVSNNILTISNQN